MVLQVILNIVCGSRMVKSLGDVTGDSEHYLWIRNGGTIGCCYR
jgi:hypothetical protein